MSNAKQLIQSQIVLPSFGLEEPYSENVWHIKEWDYYKTSTENQKRSWNARSSVMNGNIDFTICKNTSIREEIKYFFFRAIINKKITIQTLAEYLDRLKVLSSYIEQNNLYSETILDVDTTLFEKYVVSTGHKKVVENGTAFVSMQTQKATRRNRIVTFLDFIKEEINSYYDLQIPLMERDVWKESYFPSIVNNSSNKNLSFESIPQPIIKKQYKEFIRIKLNNCAFASAYNILHSLKTFAIWLDVFDDSIKSFAQIDRNVIEEYFLFLYTESDITAPRIKAHIVNLRVFMEYGIMMRFDNFCDRVLIMSGEGSSKQKKEPRYFTDDEMKGILSIVPKLKPVYRQIILLLYMLGCRFSEIARLRKENVVMEIVDKKPKYYINLFMYKTLENNRIAIKKNVYELLQKQIAENEQKFGKENVIYAIVTENNKPINLCSFNKNVKKAIVENNILGRDGKPINFTSHRMRSTKACKLISAGKSAKEAAAMLGQKSIESLSYYADMTDKEIYEKMQPMLRRETVLINSIGKNDELLLKDYKGNVTPLCNGWCVRNADLGLCPHANACLSCSCFKPSMKFIEEYKQQLQETKLLADVSLANGHKKLYARNMETIKQLETIIRKLEEIANEQKT